MEHSALEMTLAFIQERPAAAAREVEKLPIAVAVDLFKVLPTAYSQKLIFQLLPVFGGRICTLLPEEKTIQILAKGRAGQIASILRCLPKNRSKKLFKSLPDKVSALTKMLLTYSEQAVGAWMNCDILMLPNGIVVADALNRIKDREHAVDANAIPVVNEKLGIIGLLGLRDLILAGPDVNIDHLLKPAPHAISSRTSLATAVNHEGWLASDTLAVLNHTRQLIGLFHHHDLRRAMGHASDVEDIVEEETLWSGMGEAYSTTMSALIGLIGEQITVTGGQRSRKRGESHER